MTTRGWRKPDPALWAEIKLDYLHRLAQRIKPANARYVEDLLKRKHG